MLGRAIQARWENVPDSVCWLLIPVLTLAAFYLVERPGRRCKKILPPVVGGVCAVVVVSIGLVLSKPVYDLSRFAPTVWMGGAYDVSPRQVESVFLKNRMDGIVQPRRDPREANAYTRGGMIRRYGGDRVDVVLLGNSHALMWAPVIDDICQESHLTVSFNAADGSPPFPSIVPSRRPAANFTADEWFTFDSARIQFIREWRPRLVIVAHRWCGVSNVDRDLLNLLDITRQLNCRVLLIADPPELAMGEINAPKFLSTTDSTTVKVHRLKELQKSTAILKSLTELYSNVNLVETADLYIVNSGRAKVRNAHTIYYIDDNHLSLEGARVARDRIKNGIIRALELLGKE